jgi:hypothetical protein
VLVDRVQIKMATGPWTLYTLDENVQRPIRLYQEYPSKDDALRAACDELKEVHVKVELIEGPDGEKIDKDAIEQYCRSHPTP